MGTRLSQIAIHPPIYDSRRQGLFSRLVQGLAHLMSKLADFMNPVRVCRRNGTHIPGNDVFAYETWDLDQRYPGCYVGHACGRCGTVITGAAETRS